MSELKANPNPGHWGADEGSGDSSRSKVTAVLLLAALFAAQHYLLGPGAGFPEFGIGRSEAIPVWIPPSVAAWWPIIEDASRAHDVDPALVAIVILVESGGDPRARSSAGALGLMQVVPAYHPQLTARGVDPFDPAHNVTVGTGILADNLRDCAVGGDDQSTSRTVRRAAARYNGGSCTADLKFSETRRYVHLVGGMWSERDRSWSETFQNWLNASG